MLLQNTHEGEIDMEKKNLPWLAKFVRALWTYSLSIWTDRCQYIHTKQDTHQASLNHVELQTILRKYLHLPRNELSTDEKKLHLNVAQNLTFAHTTTLARWVDLLQSEREATIRRKRENRRKKRVTMRPLTSYFRKL